MKLVFPVAMLSLCASACWPRNPGPIALADAQAPVTVRRETGGPEGLVTWAATVRAGSAHDPVGQEGLAWLTAELIARQLAHTGGDVQLRVGAELVDYGLRCPTSRAAACGEAMAATIAAPRFDAQALAAARAAAHRATAAALLDPDTLLVAAARWWLWAGHPYGHAAWGRDSVVDTLRPTDLQRFHARRYLRPATGFAVQGLADDATVAVVTERARALPPRLYQDVTPRRLPTPVGEALEIVAPDALDAPRVALVAAIDLPPDHPDRRALSAGLDQAAAALDLVARAWLDPDLLQPGIFLVLSADGAADPAAARQQIDAWIAAGPTPDTARDQPPAANAPADPVGALWGATHAALLGGPDPLTAAVDAAPPSPEARRAALQTWVQADDLRTVRVVGAPARAGRAAIEGSAAAFVDDEDPPPPRSGSSPGPAPGASTQPAAPASGHTAFALSAEELFR